MCLSVSTGLSPPSLLFSSVPTAHGCPSLLLSPSFPRVESHTVPMPCSLLLVDVLMSWGSPVFPGPGLPDPRPLSLRPATCSPGARAARLQCSTACPPSVLSQRRAICRVFVTFPVGGWGSALCGLAEPTSRGPVPDPLRLLPALRVLFFCCLGIYLLCLSGHRASQLQSLERVGLPGGVWRVRVAPLSVAGCAASPTCARLLSPRPVLAVRPQGTDPVPHTGRRVVAPNPHAQQLGPGCPKPP